VGRGEASKALRNKKEGGGGKKFKTYGRSKPTSAISNHALDGHDTRAWVVPV
jgi:hypothetical protein